MIIWRHGLAACLSLGLFVLCQGCSHQPARELAPALNPEAAGAAAIAEFDTNRDGVISGSELDRCPALKRAAARIDPTGGGKITAAAIAERIRQWQASKLANINVLIVVRIDGQPLAGATVTAEPEKFLGPTLVAAKAVTDSTGSAPLRMTDKPGLHCGFYKLRVSKIAGGKESVPARYNKESELGIEVALDADELQGGVRLELNSR